ncbi:MAG TPA: translation initiation factor IF-2 [Thermoguttaceae bacterium]|nr:translation initiation factor IF-2 [Thermoguttaceae bacterium]
MPVRIYALAKQLKIDNQSLIEACKKAGVTVKGSALASLSDEEVAQVKVFLGGRGAGSASRATGTATPLGTRRGLGSTAVGRGGGKGTGDPSVAMRREDYVAPAGTGPKKVPVLTKKPEKLQPSKEKPPEPVETGAQAPEATEKTEEKKKIDKPERTGPAIKLAPMPKVQQPTPPPKPQEPTPQKPDIKLPADAIRASRAGSKPLSEHLRKHEQKRRTVGKRTSPREPSAPAKSADKTEAAPAKDRGKRGRGVAKPADDAITLGGREQRQLKRKRTASARKRRAGDEDETRSPSSQRRRLRRTGSVSTAAPRKSHVVVELPCTVRTFSEALGLPAQMVLGKLLELGLMSNIAASLDRETAELLAEAMAVEVEFREQVGLEERLISVAEQADPPEMLESRPPVITFLGHVDHGKTSLLDRIIGTDVVASEKGGITQHIRAYRIEKDGHTIAFVDTPGHEAFTAMRARGANCTDIAVLVVAADDGVMPQTEEAISHARAAEVPIVVALNKIDLPGANPERAFQQLAAAELLPSEWGGDTEVVRTSAVTGEGIDELLETLLTVAELHEYRANPGRLGSGICLEAELQPGLGVVAKMLVDRGTLRVGDVIVCGPAHGRVKAMYDTLIPRRKHKEAGPSMPVNLTGLDVAPEAGDRFDAVEKISDARRIAEERAARIRERELSGAPVRVTLESLFERLSEADEVKTLNLILRADVRGSIEAIRKELTKLEHPEVHVKVLQATVGGITEADVELANASDAVILGFSVVADEGARTLADRYGVQIRRYDIIYQVTEDLRAALEGMLKPEQREVELGRALVQRIFRISRLGTVAGCRVLSGTIQRDARIRVIRESRVVGVYPLDSLRREKDDAREVREGFECGIKLVGFNDLKEGDVLEAYRIDEVRRTF